MDNCIAPSSLADLGVLASPGPIIDALQTATCLKAPYAIAGALRRDAARVSAWADASPTDAPIVIRCIHAHAASQNDNRALADRGGDACVLDRGIRVPDRPFAWHERAAGTEKSHRSNEKDWTR